MNTIVERLAEELEMRWLVETPRVDTLLEKLKDQVLLVRELGEEERPATQTELAQAAAIVEENFKQQMRLAALPEFSRLGPHIRQKWQELIEHYYRPWQIAADPKLAAKHYLQWDGVLPELSEIPFIQQDTCEDFKDLCLEYFQLGSLPPHYADWMSSDPLIFPLPRTVTIRDFDAPPTRPGEGRVWRTPLHLLDGTLQPFRAIQRAQWEAGSTVERGGGWEREDRCYLVEQYRLVDQYDAWTAYHLCGHSIMSVRQLAQYLAPFLGRRRTEPRRSVLEELIAKFSTD